MYQKLLKSTHHNQLNSLKDHCVNQHVLIHQKNKNKEKQKLKI